MENFVHIMGQSVFLKKFGPILQYYVQCGESILRRKVFVVSKKFHTLHN